MILLSASFESPLSPPMCLTYNSQKLECNSSFFLVMLPKTRLLLCSLILMHMYFVIRASHSIMLKLVVLSFSQGCLWRWRSTLFFLNLSTLVLLQHLRFLMYFWF